MLTVNEANRRTVYDLVTRCMLCLQSMYTLYTLVTCQCRQVVSDTHGHCGHSTGHSTMSKLHILIVIGTCEKEFARDLWPCINQYLI